MFTLLLVGVGHLGGVLLEFLAREPGLGRMVVCSRNRRRGEACCNQARLSALAAGRSPTIEHCSVDLAERDRLAAEIDRAAPDILVSTASMLTWWLPELLPTAARERLEDAGFGIWLPCHLAPTLQLMGALADTSFAGPVLTAPFPDVVNCILARLEMAPTCGVGNVDEIALKLQWLAARRLGAPVDAIRVQLVGHHALEQVAFAGRTERIPPYYLQIAYEGRDVTDQLASDELLTAAYRLPGGPAWALLTAASAVRLTRALLGTENTLLHAPGPLGLPGGYPILAGAGRVQPARLEGLSLAEAVAINERSHAYDGIHRIEPDGTVVFTSRSTEVWRQELGYHCPSLVPEEAGERGAELIARFREYGARHGVRLDPFL